MAIDPNSIVDYLRSKGEDPSMAARRGLWARFRASEIYTGSATQNSALLAYLRLGDATPDLLLEKNRFNPGEDVFATVSSQSTATLENEFGLQSMQVEPGQRIKLGKLDRMGVFLITARTALLDTEMALIAVPSGSTIDVGIWSASYQYSAAPAPTTIPLSVGDEDLFDKFFNHLNDQIFLDAKTVAVDQFFKADRWFGLGFDIAIGGMIAILSPAQGVIYIGKSAIPQMIDFAFIYLRSLVDVMAALSTAEKDRLKDIINVLNAGVNLIQIGRRIPKLREADKLCTQIEALNGIGSLTVKTFNLIPQNPQPQDAKMAGAMLRNSVTKSITMVCRILKHAP